MCHPNPVKSMERRRRGSRDNLLFKVLAQRNYNVGKIFYEMMKITSINKVDGKCLANDFNSCEFNKLERHTNL